MNLSSSVLEIFYHIFGNMLTSVQNNPNIQFNLGTGLWSLFRTISEGVREKEEIYMGNTIWLLLGRFISNI